ncbi:hypothetical protein RRG08_036592 [Elysia crispata]|uniref:Uncharacterized protein n=1 Tax=Elysia crispata TaxID=231223 RepID=A0AAE0ZRA3_9GAST|nr:hypothetical protein RRG08_036592 [Elysia crispata]
MVHFSPDAQAENVIIVGVGVDNYSVLSTSRRLWLGKGNKSTKKGRQLSDKFAHPIRPPGTRDQGPQWLRFGCVHAPRVLEDPWSLTPATFGIHVLHKIYANQT